MMSCKTEKKNKIRPCIVIILCARDTYLSFTYLCIHFIENITLLFSVVTITVNLSVFLTW